MKNIHILPTHKPSKLVKRNLGLIRVADNFTKSDLDFILAEFVNIYITSDEEIKEGDWFLTPTNDLRCANIEWRITISQFIPKTDFKKIILTDNQDLIKDGIQAIDDEFLEWFVKNSSCEVVEVQKWFDYESNPNTSYKIIIPKEGPKLTSTIDKDELGIPKGNLTGLIGVNKQETQQVIDEDFAGGLDMGQIIPKEELSTKLHKGEVVDESYPKEFKQETLEEFINSQPYYGSCTTEYLEGIEEGAKWQQENSNINALDFEIAALKSLIQDMDATVKSKYSEEEVMDMFHNLSTHLPLHYEFLVKEQFKKK